MAHKPKKDPFVPIAFLIGLAILGAAVFVLVSNLLNTISNNSVKGAEDNSRQVAIADASLKPVGSVTTTKDVPKGGAAPAASTGTADGEAVYKATCFACHGTGAAGAPMITKKDQWEPRVATGLDALMTSALNGKGAMPVKGGNPALSEAEIKAAILYMTKEAGFDLGGGETAAKAPAEAAPAEKAPAEAAPAEKAPAEAAPAEKAPAEKAPEKEEAAPATEPEAPKKPEPVAEPIKPETPATPAEPSAPAAPAEKAPAEKAPEKEEAAPATEPEAPKKPEPVAEPIKPETPATPAEPSAPAAPAVKEAEPKVKTEAPAEAASNEKGEEVYKATCFACHKTGVAGAPIFGNKDLWAPRIATGMEALLNSALKGKGAMPPKGGNTALSDEDVKAAVSYMVENSK